MPHNEASRKLLIEALEKKRKVQEVADCYSVNRSTAYRLKKRFKETGSFETRTFLRGRKPALSPEKLASIQLDGSLHYTIFSGGTTVEKFKQYLENDLLPYLNPDSVLVMDNMKSHHAKAVKNLLGSSGIRYAYLPPYSPDLNPIENLWAKVKALLRKFKARTLETLPDAIQRAFRAVTPSDCSGWFCACGYSR